MSELKCSNLQLSDVRLAVPLRCPLKQRETDRGWRQLEDLDRGLRQPEDLDRRRCQLEDLNRGRRSVDSIANNVRNCCYRISVKSGETAYLWHVNVKCYFVKHVFFTSPMLVYSKYVIWSHFSVSIIPISVSASRPPVCSIWLFHNQSWLHFNTFDSVKIANKSLSQWSYFQSTNWVHITFLVYPNSVINFGLVLLSNRPQ